MYTVCTVLIILSLFDGLFSPQKINYSFFKIQNSTGVYFYIQNN